MDEKPMDKALDQFESLCEALDGLVQASRAKNWPEPLQSAVAQISEHVELLARALEIAEGNDDELRSLIEEANERLPQEFSALGKAFAVHMRRLTEGLPERTRHEHRDG